MAQQVLSRQVQPSHRVQPVVHDVVRLRTLFVNSYLIGEPGGQWGLVDTGLPGYQQQFVRAAEERFGARPPAAIVLTHGHFDHVGTVHALADRWNVPVYAHRLELPYLTGKSSYPPPDPLAGGMMSLVSPLYPRGPIDLRPHVRELPDDGSIPHLPEWRWIATPGHSPGHISLFRDSDRTLLAGDAIVTVRQESLLAVLSQTPELHGPPAYFTPDWDRAWRSVRELVALEPEIAATGHGVPLCGLTLRQQLHALARRFPQRAIPERGRYVPEPAIADEHGVRHVPPSRLRPTPGQVAGMTLAAIAGLWVWNQCRKE